MLPSPTCQLPLSGEPKAQHGPRGTGSGGDIGCLGREATAKCRGCVSCGMECPWLFLNLSFLICENWEGEMVIVATHWDAGMIKGNDICEEPLVGDG